MIVRVHSSRAVPTLHSLLSYHVCMYIYKYVTGHLRYALLVHSILACCNNRLSIYSLVVGTTVASLKSFLWSRLGAANYWRGHLHRLASSDGRAQRASPGSDAAEAPETPP